MKFAISFDMHTYQQLKRGSAIFLVVVINACTMSADDKNEGPDVTIDRNLSYSDIDAEAYFSASEANDPFFDVYEGFRKRRAADMQDATRPPPIKPYQSVHLNGKLPWLPLSDVFRFDWDAMAAQSFEGTQQLMDAVRVRRVFDHPDLKILQLMLGEGAVLPDHADGAPGVLIIVGGRGEVSVDKLTQKVSPGTRIKLEPYAVRRLYAATGPLKVLWIRWAPNGDHRYIKAGYYLTGANQHIQPKQATIPDNYEFWGQTFTTEPTDTPMQPLVHGSTVAFAETQATAFEKVKEQLNLDDLELYSEVAVFGHESDKPWLDLESITKSNLMWAKDIISTGKLLDRWIEVVRMESIFQAHYGDGRWDFNISQQAWGAGSRYVEHSHSIPEFYYMLSGEVQHWNGDSVYDAEPGDVFMTNSFQNHESRVAPNGEIWRSFGATWAPNGDRSVFERPHFLLAPLPVQPESSLLAADEPFH